MILSLKIRPALGALALLAAASASAVTVTTVAGYGPNPNAMSIVDASSNSLSGGITLTSFKTLVASAYAANNGGVVDAESVSGITLTPAYTASIDATLGASATTVNLARMDNAFGFDANSNDPTHVVSGTNYIGMQGQGSPTFAFSKGLSAFGITLIPRGADRTAKLTFTLDDGTTYATSTGSITSANANAVFFGAVAPTGRSFTGVVFTDADATGANAFNRYDDLGFVVAAPVPEPAPVVALALGGLAVLRRRRK